jgi:hypothetical protein
MSESESGMLYNWRFTSNQFVVITNPLRLTSSNLFFQLTACFHNRYVMWSNRPMWEVITFRNLKERDCATVPERCRVLPSLPSFRMLLGYAVITWSRNSKEGQSDLTDVTRNNTQRCVLRVSDSSVDRRDRRQCSSSSMSSSRTMTSMSC